MQPLNPTDNARNTAAFTAALPATLAPITVRDVAAILRRRAWLAVTVFTVTLGATLLATSRMTPVYEASCRVLLDNAPAAAMPSNLLDLIGNKASTSGDLEIAKIYSREFLSEVIRKVNNKAINDPVDLKNRLIVTLSSNDQILDIKATVKSDPVLTANVANTAARVYMEYKRNETKEKIERSQGRLERVRDKAEREKDAANRVLQNFVRNRGLADPDPFYVEQSRITIGLQNDLQAAKTSVPKKENDIAVFARQTATIKPTIYTGTSAERNGQINTYEDDKIRLGYEREIKLLDFGAQSPEIQEIDRKIVAANNALAKLAGNEYRPASYGISRNPDYGTAQTNLLNARRELAQLKKSIAEDTKRLAVLQAEQLQIGPERINYHDLRLRAEVSDTAWKQASTALQQIPYNTITSEASMRIMEPARVPFLPKSPKPLLNALMGLGGGIFLAILATYLAEYFSVPVRRSDLPVPGLPQLPAAPAFADGLPLVAGVPLLARVSLIGGRAAAAQLGSGLPAATGSAVTEDAFREIGYLLSHPVAENAARVPVVVLAGTRSDETTASVAAYLTATLVRDGVRVTLVDGDRAEPRLHTVFGKPDAPGVSDILAGRVSPTDALHIGAGGNLRFLAAGTRNDAAPMGEDTLRKLYDELGRPADTDLVVISGPSVWSARLIAPMERSADGVVLVASDVQVAPDESVARARRILTNGYQPRLLGVIVGEERDADETPALSAKSFDRSVS